MVKFTDDQRQAIEEKSNLIVSASAGSGKTTVLIEKLVGIIKNGGDLRRIVVMTFTALTATELKEKLRDALTSAIRASEDNAAHYRKQLDYLEFADISTIHTFCYNLYKRYYNEVGGDASAEILEESDAAALLDESVDQVLDDKVKHGSAEEKALVWRYYGRDRSARRLKNMIKSVREYFTSLPSPEDFVRATEEDRSKPFEERAASKAFLNYIRKKAARLYPIADRLVAESETCDDKIASRMLETTTALRVSLYALMQSDSLRGIAKEAMAIEPRAFTTAKSASPEGEELKASVRSLHYACADLFKTIRDTIGEYEEEKRRAEDSSLYSSALFGMVEETEKLYSEKKRADSKLDFADLERYAVRILDLEGPGAEIESSYDLVFLDEYQDTSRIQEKILETIGRRAKIFVVGDVKQSIYRFRLADPEIFVSRYNRYKVGSDGRTIRFNHNFRSDRRVLDFVNKLFDPLMTEDFGGIDYMSEARLVAGNERYPQETEEPAAAVYTFEKPTPLSTPPEDEFYDIAGDVNFKTDDEDSEGEFIADKIISMVGKEFYDASLDSYRPLRYSDIAILTQRNSSADKITTLVKSRGIPAYRYGDGGDNYPRDRELIYSYLRLLYNLHDDENLIRVMLSPLFSFSEKDLFDIRSAEEKTYFWETVLEYKGNQTLKIKIDDFLSTVRGHRLLSATVGVKELVERVCEELGVDAYILSGADGEERIALHNAFVSKLSGLQVADTLSSFLRYVDEGGSISLDAPSNGEDAVNVMTVHKSKGLEFPVVFLPYFNTSFSKGKPSGGDVYLDRELGISLRYYDDDNKLVADTVFTEIFKLRDREKEKEERLRLLYVATTRAKNHLFITTTENKTEKKLLFADEADSFYDLLEYSTRRNPSLAFYKEKVSMKKVSPTETTSEECGEKFDFSSLEGSYPYEEATSFPVKYSVSELNSEGFSPAVYRTDDEENVSAVSAETGTVYHKVLENVDLFRTEKGDVEEVVETLKLTGELTEEEASSVDCRLVADVLKLDVFDELRRMEVRREAPFMLYVPARDVIDDTRLEDKVLVQGVIDLVGLGEDAVLVDYKYTSLPPSVVAKKYAKQLRVYRIAVERLLGKRVRRAVLVLIRTAEAVEMPLD